jgi:hypothetical protein
LDQPEDIHIMGEATIEGKNGFYQSYLTSLMFLRQYSFFGQESPWSAAQMLKCKPRVF